MASRTSQSAAVILRAKDGPSGDRIVTLLTPVEGLVDAFVFGGPKSKLRSLASPYHAGTAWTYRDPVKDYRKLTDFDVARPFPGIREDLGRLGAAAFFAEAALRTHAFGGEHAMAFGLVTDALAAIDDADGARVDYAMVQFAFRMADALGMGARFDDACQSCSDAVAERAEAYFAPAEAAVLCSECARDGGRADLVRVSAGAVRYLARTASLSMRDAMNVSVDESSRRELAAAAFALARHVCDGPLRSLSDGAGMW